MPTLRTGRGGRRRGRSFFVTLLVVACLGLAALDVVLVLRNRSLELRVNELVRTVAASERSALVQGDEFPTITLLDLGGAPRPLTEEDREGTLLFVSSLSCDLCENARPVWDRAAPRAVELNLDVLELVLEATSEQLVAGQRPYAVAAPSDDVWSLVRRMPGVPAAILIDASGTVQRAFYGDRNEGLEQALEQLAAATR